MSERYFPLEIVEHIASHLGVKYAAQAAMCRVSRALLKFTQPRLYRSFNSLLVQSPENHAAYLKTILEYPHLAKLVHAYTFVAPQTSPWPRDLYVALPAMSNLKELILINRFQIDHPYHLDLWRYFFQNDKTPFQLTSFRLFWLGPPNARIFESMMLCSFLSRQTSLETVTIYYHTALINERDMPNLRDVTIDPSNWEYVVPGRPIRSLQLDGSMAEVQNLIKPVIPESSLQATLQNLKILRIDVEIMSTFLLYEHLSSLEVLICVNYEDKWRTMMRNLPKLKVVCILKPENTTAEQGETASWLFSHIESLTDVIFSGPKGFLGIPMNCCERYGRSSKTPDIMPNLDWYLKFTRDA